MAAGTIQVETPLSEDVVLSLRAGDRVRMSGYVYTARDAAHALIQQAIEAGEELPFDVRNQVIYYVGPTPAFGDHIIGSAGPTTALRMDKYTPQLYRMGLKATIGKGNRSDEVRKAVADCKGVYLAAIGGTGALLSKCIEEVEVIAYPELGTEAVHRLKLKSFPAIVIYDAFGNDYYGIAQHQTNGQER